MIPFEVIALSPYARELLVESARRRRNRRVRDARNRPIEIGPWQPYDWRGLIALYGLVDLPQGVRKLPLNPQQRVVWLEHLLSRGPNVVARCDGRIVGHAAVITYDRGASHELMVFVHPDFQDAGIEAAVTDDALRLARREGIDVSHLLTPTFSIITSASRTGLRAVFGGLRFVMIPLICALVIAVASQDSRGRAFAIALAIASIVFGLAVQLRELARGRSSAERVPNDSPGDAGAWMARLR
jgi:GNAT superfamily N-acetyltransferase